MLLKQAMKVLRLFSVNINNRQASRPARVMHRV